MTRPGHIRAGWSRIASLLMLLVLLARAPLPSGFMPVLDGDSGVFTVAMCSGSGATQTVHIPMGDPSPDLPASSDCPFAVLAGHATPLPPLFAPLEPTLWRSVSTPPTGPPATALAAAHPPGAPPTGPPLHV